MKVAITFLLTAICSLSGCASGANRNTSDDVSDVPLVSASDEVQPETLIYAQGPSLWSTRPNALLSMRRATSIGDLLTVVVNMNDQASLQNSLTRNRDSSEDLSLNAFFGLPEWVQPVLPGGANLAPAIDIERGSELTGSGTVNRTQQVAFRLAARVVGTEANGNLIIQGYQQSQIGAEIRYLTISGVIRAQDITRANTVSYERIADAQISYVSRGEATGSFKRNLIPRAIDHVIPF